MTTTEPTYQTSPPTYLTDEYEVVRDGQAYLCQQVEYRGDIYEMCRRIHRPGEATQSFHREHFRGKGIGPGDPGYDELVAFMDQFLIPREQAKPE
ncbi:MAG: hypothetical protein F4X58_08455 [Chloroflexi bacterium]|nr:hypothetical protein [Chloroflexota bacterium]MYC01941.1 hypothetical protein [Chloroflexota bacterium]